MNIRKGICSLVIGAVLLMSGNIYAQDASFQTTYGGRIFYEGTMKVNELDLISQNKMLNNDAEELGSNLTIKYVITEEIPMQKAGVIGGIDTGGPISSGQQYGVYIDWMWDSEPFYEYTDIIGVTWGGIDAKGNQAVLEIDKGKSYSDVRYIHPIYSSETKSFDPIVDDVWGAVSSKFALTTGAYRKFAKRGSLKIVLVNKGVAPIERFRISSKYGHSETALTPSITYDGEGLSMTINFSKK